ncbi:MAG: hypothetical protein RLY30_1322 [Pseudomonadota bacterium]
MSASNGFSPPPDQAPLWTTDAVESLGLHWQRHQRLSDQPPVHLVLLHGTGADSSSWDALMPHWPLDWSVWVVDLPGHGSSPSPARGEAMGVREMGLSLARLLASSRVEPGLVVLVGHSAGAAVALQTLVSQPATPHPHKPWRALGLAPSLIVPPALYTLALGPVVAPVLLSGPSLRLLEASCRLPGVLEAVIRSTGTVLPQTRTDAMAALLRTPGHLEGALRFMADTQLESLLQASACVAGKVELLAAADDPWIPFRQIESAAARFLPGARLSQWPHGGHIFHEQQPRDCAAWVEARIRYWLAACTAE